MSDPIEIIASNGDRWTAREGIGENPQVIIEHYSDRYGAVLPVQDIRIPSQILKDIAEHFSGKP